MIQRRLTEFSKSVIFWAVIGFSKNFTVKVQNVTMLESTKKHGDNEDLDLEFSSKLQILWFKTWFSGIFTVRA